MKNPFKGINPHLNSRLQSDDWHEFHAAYLVELLNVCRAQLLPMGYTVGLEQSMQIRSTANGQRFHPTSDLTVFDPDAERTAQPRTSLAVRTDEIILTIPELIAIDEPQTFSALAIYDGDEPVVWVELLSPSNKPPHSDFRIYRDKRLQVLKQRIVFVEIDFLHQTRPTLMQMPSYIDQEDGAYPYRISVIVPRPTLHEGTVHLHQFGVDEPIPVVSIPLSGDDTFDLDFEAPYQTTFERGSYGALVDYSQPPLNFDTYTETDRKHIVRRMAEL